MDLAPTLHFIPFTMKKIKTLLGLLALCVTVNVGCAKGVGTLPEVMSVSPSEGHPEDVVSLNLENFDAKKDIILFGGVPVKLAEAGEPAAAKTSSYEGHPFKDVLIKRQVTPPSEWNTIKKPTTGTVVVPEGLSAGDIEITVRRNDDESDAVRFTVLGTEAAGKGTVAEGDDKGSDGDEEVTPPTTATTDGDKDDGTDAADNPEAGAGDETPPEGSGLPLSYAQLMNVGIVTGFNYVKLTWTVRDVQSAFLQIPINYAGKDTDPVPYDQFNGIADNPFPADPVEDLSGDVNLALLAVASAFDYGFAGSSLNTRPLNYCYFMKPSLASGFVDDACFAVAGVNQTSYNYANVFLPIVDGHAKKTGTWKLPLVAPQNVFTIYYRDFENRLFKKNVSVARP